VYTMTFIPAMLPTLSGGKGLRSHSPYLWDVRPVTSIAVVILLVFIAIAFVVKMLTGGLTP